MTAVDCNAALRSGAPHSLIRRALWRRDEWNRMQGEEKRRIGRVIQLATTVSAMQADELSRVRDDVVARLENFAGVAELLLGDTARASFARDIATALHLGCNPVCRPPDGWSTLEDAYDFPSAPLEALRDTAAAVASAWDRVYYVGGIGHGNAKRFLACILAFERLVNEADFVLRHRVVGGAL
jgi:hypothetical protein